MAEIVINSLDGFRFGGYAAFPQGGHGPGLLLIQEIFGVNSTMHALCNDFASRGYVAVCPDLFWRQEPGIQLSDNVSADYDHAMALLGKFDVEAGMRDLLASLAFLRGLPECSGKTGTVGYCLGGKLAWLMAARSDVDCAVSYYGTGVENMLDELHDIRMPLLMHVAEEDEFVAAEARRKVLAAVQHNPAIAAFTYPGAKHAFARPGGQSYYHEAAVLANTRTAEFLGEHLLV